MEDNLSLFLLSERNLYRSRPLANTRHRTGSALVFPQLLACEICDLWKPWEYPFKLKQNRNRINFFKFVSSKFSPAIQREYLKIHRSILKYGTHRRKFKFEGYTTCSVSIKHRASDNSNNYVFFIYKYYQRSLENV